MISHTIRLIDTGMLRSPHSPATSRGAVIGLPNPLKALMVIHSEAPDKPGSAESAGRIEVEGQVELGVVPLEGTIVANRTVPANDGRRTILWTESALTVGTPVNDNVHPFTHSRLFKYKPVVLRRFGQLRCLPSTPGGLTKIRS